MLTAHVRERAVARGIDEEEIKRIVTNPIEEVLTRKTSTISAMVKPWIITQNRHAT